MLVTLVMLLTVIERRNFEVYFHFADFREAVRLRNERIIND